MTPCTVAVPSGPAIIRTTVDGSGTGAKMASWCSRLSSASMPGPLLARHRSQAEASVNAPEEAAVPPLKLADPLVRSKTPLV